jgi:hypothetical protein
MEVIMLAERAYRHYKRQEVCCFRILYGTMSALAAIVVILCVVRG